MPILRPPWLLTLLTLAVACEKDPPTAQYRFQDIDIPVASADEPVATLSVERAARYLEDGARAWGAKGCISCHSNGTYMVTRPALSAALGKPSAGVRDFFVKVLAQKRGYGRTALQSGIEPGQVIYLAAGLAEWDAHVTGSLSPETAQALGLMFDIQLPTGTWGANDCWPPYESDAYHEATVAVMAAVTAPGWLSRPESAGWLLAFERLKAYLATETPPHDYARLLLLWTATRVPELIPQARKDELVQMVWRHQRSDGGWSIRTFASPEAWGSGNRAAKLRGEPEFANPPSDGHQTGLAVLVLRQAGVSADDPRIQRGVRWLLANQRASGRWWTRSLNTDRYHFITYSGTAFPLLALAACGALPAESR